ncbi:hypothetical protein H5410_003540 [Solanum commersonii]|uniref:Uncharacterized protein n=1 Tax=Solanum commersonii TaxID=4109 RepID=A0A9J6B5X7_SOLCO|nr:hypothetical protein H5410_003540 [Solanum commersonii]
MLLFNISSINALILTVNSEVVSHQLQNKRVKCYVSILYGFVYDLVSDVYNIITIFVINAKDSHYINGIYSVKNDSWIKIDFIPSSYHLFDQNRVSLNGTINKMKIISVEVNGSSKFNKCSVISLIVDDEKFVITQVSSQYCGNFMKMSNFADHFYVSIIVVMISMSRKTYGCFLENDVQKKVVNKFTLNQFHLRNIYLSYPKEV